MIKQTELPWRAVMLAFVITFAIALLAAGVQCISTKLPFPNRYAAPQSLRSHAAERVHSTETTLLRHLAQTRDTFSSRWMAAE